MRIGNFVNRLAGTAGATALVLSAVTVWADESWTVYTDIYRPYVLPVGETDGRGMRIVRLILENMKVEYDFEYIDYGFASFSTRTKPNTVTFPWLRSAEREENFLFSRPLFSVVSKIYYNKQAFDEPPKPEQTTSMSYAQVKDYAYSDSVQRRLDAARQRSGGVMVYANDAEAIRGLLLNEIDLLPLPSSVVEATLQAEFSDHLRLLGTLAIAPEKYSLHLLAPKTPTGRAFIDAFDSSYDALAAAGVLTAWDAEVTSVDNNLGETARLVASEGFPVIVGRRETDGRNDFFAIPQGTRVLILEWSKKIHQPSASDRIYKTMVDETKVLVLNGPHVAEELFVKNMHIAMLE